LRRLDNPPMQPLCSMEIKMVFVHGIGDRL
jgi:hypothetical protein